MTAFSTFLPILASAISFILVKTIAEISCGEKVLVSSKYWTSMTGLPSTSITLKGQVFMSFWTDSSSNLLPIKRLASKTVFLGFKAAWFLAASPINLSSGVKATKDGVTLLPCSLAIISTEDS